MHAITGQSRIRISLLLLFGLVFASLSAAGEATNAPERPTWGNTPRMTPPQPDSKGRSGYWWWPKPLDGEAGGEDIGGNRGRVYGNWKRPESATDSKDGEPPPPLKGPGTRQICGGPVINFVFFDFDSADIRPEGKPEIMKLVKELKKYPMDTIVLTGHTDDVGTEAYNSDLGERRADAVKAHMIDQGIEAARISVKSMGESQPAVPNDSNMNRALNRRVEYDIVFGQ